jgi:protein disulfide-isomerase
MRLSPFAFLAGVATVSRAQSLDPDTSDSSKATVFDGITVPPLLQLTPANFDEEIKKTRYLVIKHYR